MSVAVMLNMRVQKGGRTICAVDQLQLEAGDRLHVHGSNGTGKSTLLRVLAGLEQGVEGVCAFGVAPREITLVHQKPYLFRKSVLANVAYGLLARGQAGREARVQARHWLDRLGASDLESYPIGGLSGGQRRRVALARAFALHPRLLLLDEPLADLDPDGCERLMTVLSELEEDVTVVLAEPTPPTGQFATFNRLAMGATEAQAANQ